MWVRGSYPVTGQAGSSTLLRRAGAAAPQPRADFITRTPDHRTKPAGGAPPPWPYACLDTGQTCSSTSLSCSLRVGIGSDLTRSDPVHCHPFDVMSGAELPPRQGGESYMTVAHAWSAKSLARRTETE